MVETDKIGLGTRVWAWAHVMPGARVGAECNIGEHCFIETGVVLGDRVTVKNGVAVWNGVVAEDDVFLGPNAVLTNDLRPRSKVYRGPVRRTLLERGASVGANATLLCGITVGEYAMIGAGAVVTRDVPTHALVVGVPGRVVGHVCRCGARLARRGTSARCAQCSCRYRIAGSAATRLEDARA
ncbi:MAG: N-acetyltransferase [Acidobacteria bacterium 13_1_40CM_2_68_5]|nr:MAG: N-acetyltransferase [Acidobacteria bacterium 13_1_40CM_2_68_5]OLE67268.1 MAG: N-acetyltransferase [Acidobacteria bacterium 13_1_20CM_2_68_7]